MQTLLSSAAIVAIIISLVKPFIELWIKPGDQIHDALIRLLALVMGLVGQLAYTATTSSLTTGTQMWSSASAGVEAGLTAIVVFHIVTASYFDNPTPTPPPVAAPDPLLVRPKIVFAGATSQ